MTKSKIIVAILILLYFTVGVAYSIKTSHCERVVMQNTQNIKSIDAESSGSNIIGRYVATLLWPILVIGDTIHHVAIFNCSVNNTTS